MTEHRVALVTGANTGIGLAIAERLLAKNPGVTASFSRALTEGLAESQTQEEFDRVLDASIAEIYAAAIT